MIIADMLRWFNVGLALVLVPVCTGCAVYARTWDHRLRFFTVAGYALVTVGGQLATLGQPLNWRLPALAVTTVAAVVSITAYLVKARRALAIEGGPLDDDRLAAHQLSILGAGPAAGSGRHAHRNPRPPHRGRPT